MSFSHLSVWQYLHHVTSHGGWEVVGYVACALVLATFYMRDIIPLRMVALVSNVAFIAYGLALHLTPIWVLHVLLLPINACRLVQALCSRPPFGKIAGRCPQLSTPEVSCHASSMPPPF
jgi:hypothetical protein